MSESEPQSSSGDVRQRAARALPHLRDRDVFLLALAVGIVAGFAEALYAVLRYAIGHQAAAAIVWNEVYWMAPLAATVCLTVLALVLVGLRRASGARWIGGLAPFLFVGIAAYGFGRSLSVGLSPVALLILAAGLGVAATRAVTRWTSPILRWTGRFALVAVVALVTWVVWVPQARSLARSQAIRDLPPPATDGPNILLIVWDTVRAASLSLYGYERETTPNLDRMGEASVVFERAIAPSSWTLPTHASLFTGRYPHEHLADREAPLDDRYPTLAEALSRRGYQTAGFAANLYWLGRAFGLHRGFQRWEAEWWSLSLDQVLGWMVAHEARLNAPPETQRGTSRPAVRIHADQVQEAFLGWVDARDPGRPFFGFLNLYDAHEPYEPPGETRFAREGARSWWNYQVPDTLSPAELQELRDTYDSAVYYLDRQLGRLTRELEARGLLENTVIILTSDHGETLGENHSGVLGHATNSYYNVLNVPLVVRYPAELTSGRRGDVVSLVDIPRTVMELVGADGYDHPFPGRSLRPLLAGEEPPDGVSPAYSLSNPAAYHLEHDVWPMSRGPLNSFVGGVSGHYYHYILDVRGREELYDVSTTIWERKDRSATATADSLLSAFRERTEEVRGLGDPMPPAEAPDSGSS